MCRIARSTAGAVARPNAQFWPAFKARLTPEGFDLRRYFGNAWAVYRGDQSYDVEVLFTKEAGATVTEGMWHHTQEVRKNKDGSVTLTFQVDGLNEILRWILGWGSRAKVIKPLELRDLIVAQLNQAMKAYRA